MFARAARNTGLFTATLLLWTAEHPTRALAWSWALPTPTKSVAMVQDGHPRRRAGNGPQPHDKRRYALIFQNYDGEALIEEIEACLSANAL